MKLPTKLSPKLVMMGALALAAIVLCLVFLGKRVFGRGGRRRGFFGRDAYKDNCDALHAGGDSRLKCKCRCDAKCLELGGGKKGGEFWTCRRKCRTDCMNNTGLSSYGAVLNRETKRAAREARRQAAAWAADTAAMYDPALDPAAAMYDPALDPALDPAIAMFNDAVDNLADAPAASDKCNQPPGTRSRCKCDCNQEFLGSRAKRNKCKEGCAGLPQRL